MNESGTIAGMSFAERVIGWQRHSGRHGLPWQNTRDAYRVWLSEIMLQQTQVATVTPYYVRFLERFPSVEALAQAPIESVLELWAGLGYYARARNLHRCAQVVVADFDGRFPADPQVLASLPGIGRSTAAAISAFAYGTRAAILDGNVKRVFARCFGFEGFPGAARVEKEMWALAESLLPAKQIEAYTQGLMDLGASICTRGKPVCTTCPLEAICVAKRDGRQLELPVARPRKILPERATAVVLLTDGVRVLLERRPPVGIWGGLWALPECAAEEIAVFAGRHGCQLRDVQCLPPLRHTFSHFHLNIEARLGVVDEFALQVAESGWQWIGYGEIETVAVPTPVRRLLKAMAKMANQAV